MSDDLQIPAPTTMTFEQAMQWLFEHRAIVRFFESDDTKGERPTVRITLISSNLDDRYTQIHRLTEGENVQDAFVAAANAARQDFETGEAVLEARSRLRAV